MMAPSAMNQREILELRLRNHHLSGAPLRSPGAVVGWLGAVQAQDYPGAKWSVGHRTASASDAALDRELAAGTILRTHLLRPTWHFVLPRDIRWMQQLTAPRVHAQTASRQRRLGLDARLLAKSRKLLAGALSGTRLTRLEIRALLRASGIAVDENRLSHILMHAELDLLICSGGLRGRQHTYALVDEMVPPQEPIPRDEALARLVLRYFTSHGPATDRDCAWWSGLTVADVRRGRALAGSQLESVSLTNRIYWFVPTGAATIREPLRAHLLQGFDEYVIAYSQSRDLLDPTGLVTPGASERLRIHLVVLDGQLVGRWRRVVSGRSITVDARLGRGLANDEMRAVEASVQDYADFVAAPVRLEVSR